MKANASPLPVVLIMFLVDVLWSPVNVPQMDIVASISIAIKAFN